MIGGVNTDCVAKGHCEREGAGEGCAPSCVEHEAPFYKVNRKLKRGPLKMATGSVLKSFYASLLNNLHL
jgi:hypothetical protein